MDKKGPAPEIEESPFLLTSLAPLVDRVLTGLERIR